MFSDEEIMKSIASVIGENDKEATVTGWLDTGFPPLNNASSADWNKGFPVGRLIEIAGPPSSGKTAIATKIMIAAQQAGGIAGFMDHEHSFSSDLARNMGLNIAGRFFYKKPMTFEQSVAMFNLVVQHIRDKKLIVAEASIVWVFDSLATMIPQSTLYDSKGKLRDPQDLNMNDHTALSRATATHFKAIAMMADLHNVCVIFLNQMRTKIGVLFGDPRKTTGGSAAEFCFSQRLWLSAKLIKKTPSSEPIGMEVTGKFVKNKISAPFKEASWRFMFQPDGSGKFDAERSLIEFMDTQGFIEKSGAPGSVKFEGKSINKEALARRIEQEGKTGFDKLKSLLPLKYKTPVVAEVDITDSEE